MPTYEYECTQCGHRFEKFQRITDSPARECPERGGKVKRLIGTGGTILMKGSSSSAGRLACGQDSPCCGLDSPCATRQCDRQR